MLFRSLFNIDFKNIQGENCIFGDKVLEYIQYRYPFMDVGSIHDNMDPETNLYEGQTLMDVWEFAKNRPGQVVIYYHSKGVLSASPHSKQWRDFLTQTLVTDWRIRQKEFEYFQPDVMGCTDQAAMNDGKNIMSGNFWWATTDYIATLPEPNYTDRYAYEDWIMLNNPRVHVVNHIPVNPYEEYIL